MPVLLRRLSALFFTFVAGGRRQHITGSRVAPAPGPQRRSGHEQPRRVLLTLLLASVVVIVLAVWLFIEPANGAAHAAATRWLQDSTKTRGQLRVRNTSA